MDQRIEDFYNKFNEEKRLLSRKGQIEYITTMKYIHECLAKFDHPKVLEVGAGTGRYCVALANEGYDGYVIYNYHENFVLNFKFYTEPDLDISNFEYF